MPATVYTIGHSNHPIGRLIALLEQNGINTIADVRSIPASRRNPQYNRDALRKALTEAGIHYHYLGAGLGAKTTNPALMENGKPSFAKIAASDAFTDALAQLIQIASDTPTAILCAEKDPLDCHRTHLIAPQLDRQGVAVIHLLADGQQEIHADVMTRLLQSTGTPEADMFHTRDELIAQALAVWEKRMME